MHPSRPLTVGQPQVGRAVPANAGVRHVDQLGRPIGAVLVQIARVDGAAVHPVVASFLMLLAVADAVNVESPTLTSWNTDEPIGDPENTVARFSWVDDDGQSFVCTLAEGGIAQGEWIGDSFFCSDAEGEPVQITLYKHNVLTPKNLAAAQAPN